MSRAITCDLEKALMHKIIYNEKHNKPAMVEKFSY